MSDRQYRTLGEGDRRLPGYECRLRYVPHAQWVPSGAAGIIDADDIRRAEYRVPCSATVAPDGYEVVDRARLPKGAIVRRETWAVWSARKDAWVPSEGGYPCLNIADGIVYAAPADELTALYAAGDDERKRSATAPASPCPTCSHHAHPEVCFWCMGTGRIQRPPLTPDQVAALPDGARVVVEPREPQAGTPHAAVIRNGIILPVPIGSGEAYSVAQIRALRIEICRVWLAEDAE